MVRISDSMINNTARVGIIENMNKERGSLWF